MGQIYLQDIRAGPSQGSISADRNSYRAFFSGSIFASFCHASGIIIITASGMLRPPQTRSSRTLSNAPAVHIFQSISFQNIGGFHLPSLTADQHSDIELLPESEEVASTIGRSIDSCSFDKPSFSASKKPSRAVILS